MNTKLGHVYLTQWLTPLVKLLENSDDLSLLFAVSYLLNTEGIEHRICAGSLDVQDAGTIELHYWINLAGNIKCDFRARVTLGPAAPHGVFFPTPQQCYVRRRDVDAQVDSGHFEVLTGRCIEDFPSLLNVDN